MREAELSQDLPSVAIDGSAGHAVRRLRGSRRLDAPTAIRGGPIAARPLHETRATVRSWRWTARTAR